MVLTDKQKEDLNKGILEYLEKNNYKETSLAFQIETKTDYQPPDSNAITDVLEKKWNSIIRLQKKVMDLEQQIEQLNDELKEKCIGGALLNKTQDVSKMFLSNKSRHVLESHRGVIQSISIHNNYNLVASGSEDCTVKVWDYDSGQLEKTLKGHTQSVNYVCFDDKYLASASSDLTVKLWDIQSFTCVRTLHGHDHSVSCVKFISNDLLVTCSRDKSIKVFELQTGYCKKTLLGHDDWVRRVAVDRQSQLLASGGCDVKIVIWNMQTMTQRAELEGHQHVIEDLMWVNHQDSKKSILESEKGQALLLTNKNNNNNNNNDNDNNSSLQKKFNSLIEKEKQKQEQNYDNFNFLVSCSRDKLIKVWSVELEQCLYVLSGHDNWVRGLAMHHSHKYIYSVSDDKSIRAWDLQNSKQHRKVDNAHNHFVAAIDSNVKYMVTITAGVDHLVKVWPLK